MRPFSASDLAESTGLPVRQVEEILFSFEERGIVEPAGDGWFATEYGLSLASALDEEAA